MSGATDLLAGRAAPEARPAAPGGLRPGWILAALLLLVWPLVASPFFTLRIGAAARVEGTIALSLMFLYGTGGMASLMQMTVAGLAGYGLAILGVSSGGAGLPWWAAVPHAVAAATLFAALAGAVAVRTAGIQTIMITLAVAVGVFYLAQQNYDLFNGYDGYRQIAPPALFGLDWTEPAPFYYLSLAVAALCCGAVAYVSRAPFGLALQGIRDNPRRMAAIGFDVRAHRIAAYAFAGLIAALGGVLLVWFQGRISPGTIAVDRCIEILVIAILGGTRHPVGPFLGALAFVLLQNFAIDLIDRERFNTVIGLAFLLVVLFSPDGLLGLIDRARRARPRRSGPG